MTAVKNIPDNIFLVGYMGCGKSTAGRKLAALLGFAFVDMDTWIEQREGKTVGEIFGTQGGEARFRELEGEAIRALGAGHKQVIATGGGAPCHHNHMQLMMQVGRTVYIRMTPEGLVSRLLAAKEERPLIKGKSEKELLEFVSEHLAARERFYKQAEFVVEGINLKAEEIAAVLGTEKQD